MARRCLSGGRGRSLDDVEVALRSTFHDARPQKILDGGHGRKRLDENGVHAVVPELVLVRGAREAQLERLRQRRQARA